VEGVSLTRIVIPSTIVSPDRLWSPGHIKAASGVDAVALRASLDPPDLPSTTAAIESGTSLRGLNNCQRRCDNLSADPRTLILGGLVA
jgi:hypothetical protein